MGDPPKTNNVRIDLPGTGREVIGYGYSVSFDPIDGVSHHTAFSDIGNLHLSYDTDLGGSVIEGTPHLTPPNGAPTVGIDFDDFDPN